MIAYRTRLGFAVVAGDPIGDQRRFRELVADFAAMCHTRGWHILVLGCISVGWGCGVTPR